MATAVPSFRPADRAPVPGPRWRRIWSQWQSARETSGSILSPSNQNSLVGIKPTVGLISRTGIIPIAASQDTAGPMARTVTDAAILLGVLTARDPQIRRRTMANCRPTTPNF